MNFEGEPIGLWFAMFLLFFGAALVVGWVAKVL